MGESAFLPAVTRLKTRVWFRGCVRVKLARPDFQIASYLLKKLDESQDSVEPAFFITCTGGCHPLKQSSCYKYSSAWPSPQNNRSCRRTFESNYFGQIPKVSHFYLIPMLLWGIIAAQLCCSAKAK